MLKQFQKALATHSKAQAAGRGLTIQSPDTDPNFKILNLKRSLYREFKIHPSCH